MKVVHMAKSPLAGSPIRIVRALNEHSDVCARLIVGNTAQYGDRTFEGDLDWQEDREKARSVLESADIVHLHRYMDLKAQPFGIDFDELQRKGKRILRQFHANPGVIAGRMRRPVSEIVDDPLPQLVIAQFHERFYPRARVVPNIVPIRDSRYRPTERADRPVRVFYAPTFPASAWASRWETKGSPETRALLRRIVRRASNAEADVAVGIPHDECLRRRRNSHISIDEMVTGSYHMSGLESLAQGIPTFAFLDTRCLAVLAEITGATELPWMNFRLEEAEEPLRRMIDDPELRRETGARSREWMETYWDDRQMVGHYVKAYRDVLERPDTFDRPRFDPGNRRTMWTVQGMDDAVWNARRRRNASLRVRWRRGNPCLVNPSRD
ncbi:glycosyltransferase family 1 protein [Verrucomicrobiota bacterium]